MPEVMQTRNRHTHGDIPSISYLSSWMPHGLQGLPFYLTPPDGLLLDPSEQKQILILKPKSSPRSVGSSILGVCPSHGRQWVAACSSCCRIASILHRTLSSQSEVRVAGASIQAGQCRASPGLGLAALSLFQDKRIIVFTLVAAWHKDGKRTP